METRYKLASLSSRLDLFKPSGRKALDLKAFECVSRGVIASATNCVNEPSGVRALVGDGLGSFEWHSDLARHPVSLSILQNVCFSTSAIALSKAY